MLDWYQTVVTYLQRGDRRYYESETVPSTATEERVSSIEIRLGRVESGQDDVRRGQIVAVLGEMKLQAMMASNHAEATQKVLAKMQESQAVMQKDMTAMAKGFDRLIDLFLQEEEQTRFED